MAARNGTGSYVRSYDWTDDAANSIPITASRFDTEMDGIASELTNSLALDGQSTMAGILKMGGYKIQNVAAAAALTDAPNATQISNNSFGYLGTTGGTSAAYTLTPSPAITAYATGQEFSFTTNATNTLSSSETTLAISGLAATNLRKLDSSGSKIAVAASDLISGITYKVRYDGTHFLLTDNSLQDAPVAASDTVAGIVELLTTAEALTGTDTTRAMTAAAFAGNKSLSQQGYYKFPAGLILQWGRDAQTGASGTVTFPTAFGSACYTVVACSIGTGARYLSPDSISTSQFTWNNSGAGQANIGWIAIGV